MCLNNDDANELYDWLNHMKSYDLYILYNRSQIDLRFSYSLFVVKDIHIVLVIHKAI